MNKLLFLVWLMTAGATQTAQAQVGIGITTPSPNAMLDVTSTTKGLLLPRLPDTLAVRNPSAGLLIFNQKTKSAALHDGTRWGALALRGLAGTGADSVTYLITTGGGGFVAGELGAALLSTGIQNVVTGGGGTGGGSAGRPTFGDVLLTKPVDANSIAFTRAIATGAVLPTVEFRLFKPRAATPFYSIKVTSARLSNYAVGSGNGAALVEQLSFVGTIVGFKNWVTNATFAWDVSRNTTATY